MIELVKKIKKKVKKGPNARYAVPMALVLTCLYGSRLEGKDFRYSFESPQELRMLMEGHLGQEVLLSDRVLSGQEYQQWGLKSSPGRLAGMFTRGGCIPMGPAVMEARVQGPELGVLPVLALVKGKALEEFAEKGVQAFSELHRVALERQLSSCFQLIPGYDTLLYSSLFPARALNRAVVYLNDLAAQAFERGQVAYPGPFESFLDAELSEIPAKEVCRD